MSAPCRIEPCGAEAACVLAAIHREAFSGGEIWDAETFSTLLSAKGVTAYLALQGEEPGGFVLLRQVEDEGEILTLAVRPACRRSGMGKSLVKKAVQNSFVTFLEVSVHNKEAYFLYEKCGFIRAGRRPAYYPDGSDALILVFKS